MYKTYNTESWLIETGEQQQQVKENNQISSHVCMYVHLILSATYSIDNDQRRVFR